jgi:glycosyltransferase involved in cell wall biosynthesis
MKQHVANCSCLKACWEVEFEDPYHHQGGTGDMSRPLRLLFVSSRYLFPADSGGKIRTVNVLRGMKGGAFEITLASPLPAYARSGDSAETSSVCDCFIGWPGAARGALFRWTRMRHLVSTLPVAVATDASSAGRRAIAGELEPPPEVLVVDFPHAAVLAPPPYPCPSVLFTHNVEAEIFRRHAEITRSPLKRAIWRNQATKMERYERELLPKFTAVVAVADRDREYFQRVYGAGNVSTIPTGVDLGYFTYGGNAVLNPGDGGTVVFTGSMDWMANIDGVEFLMDAVWQAVSRARPAARCVIVGRSPPQVLIERARARMLDWEFTGFVDDVRPFVQNAHVYVIPLRVGGGTRIKVYEAMAMGCPVVSTRIGVEGLPVEHDRHYLEADSADAMAAAVLALLHDRERSARLSLEARKHVEESMSTRQVGRVFEQICLGALQSADVIEPAGTSAGASGTIL